MIGSKTLPDLIRFPQTEKLADEQRSWSGAGSYIDAMYRILIHKQWTNLPRHMIAGMTANVFRLVVDRRLTTESISAYNWMAENFVAADFIGVTTGQHGGFSFEPTFPLYQKQALLDMMMGSRCCSFVRLKKMKSLVCPMILLVGTVRLIGIIRFLSLIQSWIYGKCVRNH